MASVEPVTSADLQSRALGVPGPVVLDLYQARCPPCRALAPRLERVAQPYEGRLPVYRVDLDRDMPLAERFGVTSIPTVLIVRDGREVARLDGLITDAELTATFDRALAR